MFTIQELLMETLDITSVRSLTLLQTHPTTLYVTYVTYPSLIYNTVTLYNLFTLYTYTVYLHYCTQIYTIYLNNALPFNQPWGSLNYKIYPAVLFTYI